MKMFRDLWRLRGQVLAIALVIGSGVATLVMSLSTVEALQDTTDAYYQRYRFADVFAYATRAPRRLVSSLQKIDGVQSVQTRITEYVTVDVAGFAEPVVGQIMSIPDHDQPLLNHLVIRQGRWVAAGRSDEIILSEPFAQAHKLQINDSIGVILNGKKRDFRIVGLALSPEFIYSIGPGALMPEDLRFGVMWASEEVLEAAFDLDQAFNSVALKLMKNASVEQVLDQVDRILQPYGGISAIPREDQISNWFVMNEIAQQKTMATILPGIFILVSVFLTNMVLSRLIATERTEIGLLKAFGYSNQQLAWQYIKMVMLICLLGWILGSGLGALFGRMNTQMYAEMFRFPLFIYQPGLQSFGIGGLVSSIAVLIGALLAVRAATRLPPAEAMTPPSPPVYSHPFSFTSPMTAWLDQPTRIAIRQIARWPLRSFFTSFGIALSAGLIVMNIQWTDSLSHLSRVFFFETQKQDVMVGVPHPVPLRAIYDFEHIPGVLRAEPMRMVAVEFNASGIAHRGAINGIEQKSTLQPIYDDAKQTTLEVPKQGLMVSTALAKRLNVGLGDSIWVNVLEGTRKQFEIKVVGLFETYIGTPAFIELNQLNRLLGESPRFEYANLKIDHGLKQDLFLALKQTPGISAVMLKESALNAFNSVIIEHLMVFISMFVLLACILAFGVVYNSTRIALSERARELATLRVLGFTKGEISYVLLGEVMFLVLFGLPLGAACGWLLVQGMASAFDTEMFRVPLVIEASTFGMSAVLVIVAAVLSAAVVRRRTNHLDLIKVLKTRE